MTRDFQKAYFEQGKAFLESLITMDETWVLYSTPELKRLSTEWVEKGSNLPRKAKVMGSMKKITLSTFFDIKGMVYQHYVLDNQIINSDYYIGVMTNFLKLLRKKRPEKVANMWLLHQDNARPHVSQMTMAFIISKNIKLIEHAPYSPDLAPADFWLFPNLKSKIAGMKFEDKTALQIRVHGILKELTKENLYHVSLNWYQHLVKCVDVHGDYYEK